MTFIPQPSKKLARWKILGLVFQLTSPQQLILIDLIEELTSTQPDAIAAARMRQIREDGLENIKFVWIGSRERGDAHYYRVQGPSFLIEYDNTQNDANHVHLVWRDFTGDFGRDLIRLHYQAAVSYTQLTLPTTPYV